LQWGRNNVSPMRSRPKPSNLSIFRLTGGKTTINQPYFPSIYIRRLSPDHCLFKLAEEPEKSQVHHHGLGPRNRRWSCRRRISRTSITSGCPQNIFNISQGRAGLVALRRSRGEAVGALGKAFYKGGFEPKMNRREAALILQLRYASISTLVEFLTNRLFAANVNSPRNGYGRITVHS